MTQANTFQENTLQENTLQENIVWHQHAVEQDDRAAQKQQKPCVLWFTGLSGSGKSTIAGALEQALVAQGYHTYLLDGDNVRHGLCADLGFSEQDRSENIRRVGEVARLMTDAGLIVLASFISPERQQRNAVRERFTQGEFYEVFVNAPLALCEQRDPKGLYKKARSGEIRDFTGIHQAYQVPVDPELVLQPGNLETTVELIVQRLRQDGILLRD